MKVSALWPVLVTACGRFGFDPTSALVGTDGGTDGSLVADAAAFDPDGFWIVIEARESSSQQTLQRSDLVDGIRADVTIDGGQHRTRFLRLGVPFDPAAAIGSFDTTGDLWVFRTGDDSAAFIATSSGPDDVTLVWDDAHPTNVGVPLLDGFVLARSTPPPASLAGLKALTRTEYANTGEFAAGTCSLDGTGNSWIVTGTIDTSLLLISDTIFEFENFTGVGCAGPANPVTDAGQAYIEIEGTTWRSWGDTERSPPFVMSGTFTISPVGNRFVRTACTPANACAELPLLFETTP